MKTLVTRAQLSSLVSEHISVLGGQCVLIL